MDSLRVENARERKGKNYDRSLNDPYHRTFLPCARAKFEERDERIVSQSLQTFLFPYRRTPLRLDHLLGHEIRKGMKQMRRKMGGGKEGWREQAQVHIGGRVRKTGSGSV